MQRLVDFTEGKPPKGMAHQHHGIVHGSEFVISAADHEVRRELLDKYYEGENFTRSINDDGEVILTINVLTSENKDG